MRRILTIAVAVATLMTVTAGTASAGRGDNPRVNKVRTEKVDVCHYDAEADEFHLINISPKAVEKHLAHGDATPGSVVPDTDGFEFDSECVAIATGPIKVVDGDFLKGTLQIGLTVFESGPGEFSGTGRYRYSTSYNLTTDILDACTDPSHSRAVALGRVKPGSSHFVSQYTIITIERHSDGSMFAYSKLKATPTAASDYFAKRCTGWGPLAGPGSGFLAFS